MWIINAIITYFFDFVLFPFATITPWVGLIVVSSIVGIVMLFIFKLTSQQDKIKREKDYVKGYLLQMRIFKDDITLLGDAQKNILKHNMVYLRYSIIPIIFILVPVILVMIQLNVRYGPAPLEVGETVVVKAYFDRKIPDDVTILPGEGYDVETEPVRVKREGEMAWRVRATKAGTHTLTISTPKGDVDKTFVVAPGKTVKISERRVKTFWDHISYPGEKPIPSSVGMREIRINYAANEMALFGIPIHWIITFFLMSVVAGFALKGVFGVEI